MSTSIALSATSIRFRCRIVSSFFRSHQAFVLKNLALRHQLYVLQRSAKRPRLSPLDRSLWVLLSRVWRDWRDSLILVKPETVVRWHRQGFRLYWKRKGRGVGRPRTSGEIRDLVRRMAKENPLWGAPRIHGELLKLGLDVGQATVPIDFFTVPTATFRVVYVFLVLSHERRRVVHFNVTDSPTALWTARQLVRAFPWDSAPRLLLRDRDAIDSEEFQRTVRNLRIEDVRTAPHAPWQNPDLERLIGSIRRECLDHVVILTENHLRRVLREYLGYYTRVRTHLGLGKDCPEARAIEPPKMGEVVAIPQVGGLHHRYTRQAA